MKDEERNTNKINIFISIISIILLFLVSFLTFFFGNDGNYALTVLKFLGYMVLSFTISLIAHETGHLLFGLATGYKLLYFQILFLKLERIEGKLRLRFIVPKLLGQCLLSFDKDSRAMEYSFYMYGGSIMNLSLMIASISAFLVGFFVYFNFHIFYLTLFFVNFHLFLSNGIPLNVGNIYNDALNLKFMKKYVVIRKAIFNQLKMQEEINDNKTINEISDYIFTNGGYEIPYKVSLGYTYSLLRTMKRVVNDIEDPFIEVKKIHEYINYYPAIYQNSNYVLLLFNNLINDKEYEWILKIKRNEKLFSKKDKNDPILNLDLSFIDYKNEKISLDEFKSRIQEIDERIDKIDLSKVEQEFYHKLIVITNNYLTGVDNT